MHTQVQRLVPAAEAAQSSHQACCTSAEVSMAKRSSGEQLHDREDGVLCGQMQGQPERQSRSSGGLSHRQQAATSRSETTILSKRTSMRLSNQLQHSAFRGVDATDQCSARDIAGLISHSVGLSHSSHGSSSARPDGSSPFASMQQTQHGQADSPLSPMKVCLKIFC